MKNQLTKINVIWFVYSLYEPDIKLFEVQVPNRHEKTINKNQCNLKKQKRKNQDFH